MHSPTLAEKKLNFDNTFNSTHYDVLHPQNDDRIVTIDSVTSFYPVYGSVTSLVTT